MTATAILLLILYAGSFISLLVAIRMISSRLTILEGLLRATINTVKSEQDARIRHQFREDEND